MSLSSSTQNDGDVPREQVGKPLLFMEDPLEILARMSSSRSLGSITDNDEEQQQLQQSCPGLRRVGTYPCVSGPPRKPIRSSSEDWDIEDDVYSVADSDNDGDNDSSSQGDHHGHVTTANSNKAMFEEGEGDAIDLEKYHQLLMGNNDYCDQTISNTNTNSQDSEEHQEHDQNGQAHPATSGCQSLVQMKLCPREMSWGSAPSKFLRRDNSGSNAAQAAMPSTPATRKSCSSFRPIRHVRRPRRSTRSLVQDMLSPASETSSRSIRVPPRLPSRVGSDLSNVSLTLGDGAPTGREPNNQNNRNTSRVFPAMLVLCNKASASTTPSFASICSSSQKSANTTTSPHREAPRLPRRSLSPIFGESLRSLLQQHELEDQQEEEYVAAIAKNQHTKPCPLRNSTNTASTAAITVMTDLSKPTGTTLRSIHNRRKRNTPLRAKTFSFCVMQKPADMAMTVIVNQDPIVSVEQQTCISSPEKTVENLENLWTAKTWPKPRRNRVAPGRSRTYTSHQTTSNGFWAARDRC